MGYTSLLFTYLLTYSNYMLSNYQTIQTDENCMQTNSSTYSTMSRYSWHITETTQLALQPAHPKHVSTKFAVQTEFLYC